MGMLEPSPSAIVCAALRAHHFLFDEHPVFVDPYALELTTDEYRRMHAEGRLQAHFARPGFRRVQAHVLGRGRYGEEALEIAMDGGAEQYVLLGAGLDSFVLRRPELLERLRVFEVDLPATQAYKRARLETLGFQGHPRVELLAADLRETGVDRVLATASFDPGRVTFFLWLGVVAYLTRDAVLDSLRAVRACCAPGSRVLLDYPVLPELLDDDGRELAREVSAETERQGEARRVKHDPHVLQESVRGLGYAIVEDLAPADMEARWFAGRTDGLHPFRELRLLQLRAQ